MAFFLVNASIGAGAIVMAPLHAQTAPGIPAARPLTAVPPSAATERYLDTATVIDTAFQSGGACDGSGGTFAAV
jgi:hypothetical protein